MRTRIHRYLICLVTLVLLASCEAKVTTFAPTQVMVRIEASNEVLASLDSLSVRIAASDDGKKWQKRGDASYAAKQLKWPVDIPVTPSSETDPIRLFEVVAEALDAKDEVLVQARAITGFVKGEQRLLVMRLEVCGEGDRGLGFVCESRDGCYGTSCERCVMGECRETEVTDPAKLEPLTPETPSGPMDAAVPLDSATADAGSTCPTGLEGKNCDEDIDECLTLCTQGSCENMLGSFICTCPPSGLILNPSATDCDDVDECSDPNLCGQSTGMGTCTNTFGAHECACKLGQTGSLCDVVEQCLTSNVCNADYPCVEESAPLTYRCAGQFPEWQDVNALGPYVVSDDTTTDTKTGLVWQRVLDPTERTWDAAKAYCSSLTLAGGNWRVPTITELRSIIDRSRWGSAIDPVGFEGSSECWSSSPYLGEGGGAWTVNFSSGSSSGSAVNKKNVAIRCVR